MSMKSSIALTLAGSNAAPSAGKITPGPWIAECVGVSSFGPDGIDVYEVNNGHSRIAEHMGKADAILTAAAPGLRDALKGVMNDLMLLGRVEDATSMRAFEAIGKASPADGAAPKPERSGT